MIIGFLRSFALTLASWLVELLGLVVVAIGVHFPRTYVTDTGREITRMQPLFLLWDNAYDGLDGDARLWWHNYCLEHYGKPATHWFCRYMWAALRNPANFFSRNICGVDVSSLRIVQLAGTISDEGVAPYRGWLLLKGMAEGGKVYPRFYLEFAIWKTYGLMFDIGWKVKLSHNGTTPDAPEKDRIKGIVCTLSPWKELS